MRDLILKVLALSSALGGTVAGLVLRTQYDISADTGAIVGIFSIIGGPIGIVIALLLFLTLTQHAGTREKLEELHALVVTLPEAQGNLAEEIRTFKKRLGNLAELFGSGTVTMGGDYDFRVLLAFVPEDCRLELSDRWSKLKAIATTRLPDALWVGLFATNFVSLLLVAMVQMTPVTTVVVLTGVNLLFGGLSVLIADFDDPFTGWFNVRNPFAE